MHAEVQYSSSMLVCMTGEVQNLRKLSCRDISRLCFHPLKILRNLFMWLQYSSSMLVCMAGEVP